jgi:hypothetical protein
MHASRGLNNGGSTIHILARLAVGLVDEFGDGRRGAERL